MTQPAPIHMQWLELAKQDLAVAKHLYDIYRPMPFEIICYHSQQAAEKGIKAVYAMLDLPGGIPRTHDLSMLLDQMHNVVAVDDTVYDCADNLTPYGTTARYPTDDLYDERGSKTAIEEAQMILDWATDIIIASGE